MKLLLVFAAVISSTYAAIMCNSMDGDTLTAAACTDAGATKCTSPVVVEYTGLSNQAYGCGDCSAVTDGTCAECTGTETEACNAKVEEKTFKCFSYTYNTTSTAWEKSAEAGDCKANQATAVKCQKPGATVAAETTFLHNGCGPCAANAGTVCETCEGDSCNSAATLSLFIAPLIAVLFSLM